ncbi:MAG: leucyl aminopeptidase [Candidatus Puniceispirillaceae bacterium]
MSAYLSVEFQTIEKDAVSVLLIGDERTSYAGDKAAATAFGVVADALQFTGKSGTSALHIADGKAILAVGVGGAIDTSLDAEKAGAAIYKALRTHNQLRANITDFTLSASKVADILYGAVSQSYEFNTYFTKKDEPAIIRMATDGSSLPELESHYSDRAGLLKGVFMSRDLTTEPANILFPEEFARRCEALSVLGLEVEVLSEADMQKLGMGALLGVGQGSVRESKMVVMKWNGGGDEAPLAFVGKGVCFDTGGISLKPAKGMEDMKWDMGGASAVTGAMCAIASRKVKRNIVGIIGLVENMPDGEAQRPGDVVTSMSGQTIEVINTDAEGRLVLADCLTYCQQEFKPQMIIDLATLTGAILVALGKEHAGLFCNNDGLRDAIMASGQNTAETCWPMPMGDAYQKMLKSHIADMKNIGGPWGGSITAACFLERFITNDTAWAHIDIAGKAWADGAGHAHPSGGTGFGVRLLNDIADHWADH